MKDERVQLATARGTATDEAPNRSGVITLPKGFSGVERPGAQVRRGRTPATRRRFRRLREIRVRAALRRRWWLVVITVVTVVAAADSSIHSSTSYIAEGSYVLRADAEDTSDLVRASATLAGSDEMVNTYANIVTSQLIEDAARESLRSAGYDASDARATSELVAEANVLLIGARSEDPVVALAMARAVSARTQDYLRELGDVYRLEMVDGPTLPGEPVRQSGILLLVASALVGSILGVGLVLAAEWGFPPRRRMRHIVDPDSTAFDKDYLALRLRQEFARAEAEGLTFCIGVLRVVRRTVFDPEALEAADLRSSELTAITEAIRSTLLPKDILAHLGRSRFAAIIPLTTIDDARDLVERWRQLATLALLHSQESSNLIVLTGACTFDGSVCIGDEDGQLVVSELSGRWEQETTQVEPRVRRWGCVGVEQVLVADSDRVVVGSTPRREEARTTITRTTITPAPGVVGEKEAIDHTKTVGFIDRLGTRVHGDLTAAEAPFPGTHILRLIMSVLLSALCLLTVGGAILVLLLWQQDRASGVLTSQLERTWDIFDILRRVERLVAFAVLPVATAWIALASINVKRATGIRRNPIVAAASLPIGVIGAWYVGREVVSVADDWVGEVSGVVLQSIFLAVPLLALLRVAQAAEARNRPLRATFVVSVGYLVGLQFLGGLSTVDQQSPAEEWGRLGAYLIIGALMQVLGTLSANEAARAIEEGSEHRYELRHRFGESLLAQAARG